MALEPARATVFRDPCEALRTVPEAPFFIVLLFFVSATGLALLGLSQFAQGSFPSPLQLRAYEAVVRGSHRSKRLLASSAW